MASAIFMLVSGSLNVVQWYPWEFSFRATHYAVAWVATGSLVLHVAVKLPVNRTAREADAVGPALDPEWRLTVAHAGEERSFGRDDLLALTQAQERLPIACVEGWSRSADWSGVRVRDLLELVGAPSGVDVRVESLQRRGAFATSVLPAQFCADPRTLLALGLNGTTLALDHGYPCRIIAPNRPGVLQTKWVTRLETLA